MTGSIASLGALAGTAAYTASKHGVAGLINQLACEFAPQGVRVNGVAPGAIRTKMSSATAELVTDGHAWAKSMTPLGRFGAPEEIAAPVLFLASDDASFITGTSDRCLIKNLGDYS